MRDGLAFKIHRGVPPDLECLVEVKLPHWKKLTIVTCYRQPHQNMNDFLNSLESVLSSVCHGDLCLTGDFNAKHSEW